MGKRESGLLTTITDRCIDNLFCTLFSFCSFVIVDVQPKVSSQWKRGEGTVHQFIKACSQVQGSRVRSANSFMFQSL